MGKIEREIEESDEMHIMVENENASEEEQDEELSRFFAEDVEDEEDELSGVEEEDECSGSGRDEEERRAKEMGEKVNKMEEKQEEAIKQDVAQIEQEEQRIEIERVLMSRPNDEGTKETLADKVLKRLMKRQAEKDREEEEKRRLEERKKESTLRLSLFPNMPLFINFVTANSLPGIEGKNMPESLKTMGWHVWKATGKNAVPDKTQNEGWTIQSKNCLLAFS